MRQARQGLQQEGSREGRIPIPHQSPWSGPSRSPALCRMLWAEPCGALPAAGMFHAAAEGDLPSRTGGGAAGLERGRMELPTRFPTLSTFSNSSVMG